MKRILFILLALWALCAAQEMPLIDRLPLPANGSGWRFDIEPQSYLPDNLFEYINGEAELYNDYHFAGMATAAYIRGDDMNMTYSVDISDMGTPLDAFGIYSRHRSPELEYAAIGEEATVSELNIRFYKGRYFVQINAGSFEEAVREEMLRTANAIAETLPVAPMPRELALLPQENQLPHSLVYYTRGMLGQSLFPAGLMAKFVVASDTVGAFLVLTSSAGESLPAFQGFSASLKERGSLLAESPGRIEVETPYQGRILALHHLHWIVGVMGYKERETAERLAAGLSANLGE
ncbi:MAG TPA: hypothetical protein PKJ13_06430 [bacterium]|nr:hypothetical protein [bacterium]